MRNILMAISGPSGVGKGTLVKELISARTDVAVSVSCTTRAPREGEKDGKDYFFLTREEFLRRRRKGNFSNTTSISAIITARRSPLSAKLSGRNR